MMSEKQKNYDLCYDSNDNERVREHQRRHSGRYINNNEIYTEGNEKNQEDKRQARD